MTAFLLEQEIAKAGGKRFYDYSRFYSNVLKNDRKRQEIGIEEEEVGEIEDAAFKIIRFRDMSKIPSKTHLIIRNFPKYCKHAKKEILAISNEVKDDISEAEKITPDGKPVPIEVQDKIWAASVQQDIIHHI